MRRWRWIALTLPVLAVAIVAAASWMQRMPLPESLGSARASGQKFLAADGTPLNQTFRGGLNRTDAVSLDRIPLLMRQAFVMAEDQRYWEHGGADWDARLAALWGNFRSGRIERGASTIGEQAARILEPRPRTYWSHWLAGIDATRLIHRFGRGAVLEFYLNQVPYGAQRRGVVQAARYYYGRDPDALNPAEQLSLAVLARSPDGYDPRRQPRRLRHAVDRLAARLASANAITQGEVIAIQRSGLHPARGRLALDAGAFVVYAQRRARESGMTMPVVRTTLDPDLQQFVQQALTQRVATLAPRQVHNGAALVVDNRSGDILAWATAPADQPFGIDPVLAPRQPGSTLKPFVYGLAMARLGWQADHVLRDAPLAERIDDGVHRYRNYSGRYYGTVSLRYALANSLNIPAVRTAQAVGVPEILRTLQAFGFTSFRKSADHYGPAVVLGDGAVSLLELVQAYASLARHGEFLPLQAFDNTRPVRPEAALPADVTALLADILADPDARSAEFGASSILDLPYPTAIKTGTSSDYHDLWTVGFDDRYTVGIWMGNLDGSATDHLTGSFGPAPLLRQVFAELRRAAPYAGLWRSPAWHPVDACEWIGPPPCIHRREWYLPRAGAWTGSVALRAASSPAPVIAQPIANEILAIDPRLPGDAQRLHPRLDAGGADVVRVVWRVDGVPLPARAPEAWPLVAGTHRLDGMVWLRGDPNPHHLTAVDFTVLGGEDGALRHGTMK